MKVRVHPGDDRGVGSYRMRYPALAARAEGVDVCLAGGLPIQRARFAAGPAIRVEPLDADVLVFQRPSNPEIVALIPALQKRGHAVVVDVDDDLSCLPVSNRARGTEDHRLILKACALADLVTVSTPALAARYAAHGRVQVLANCVPAGLLDLPRASDGHTVGWAGWIGTHPHDLQVTRNGVAQALAHTGARFQVVGPGEGVGAALSLAQAPAATGGLAIDAYHDALGTLDVGICPLADTTFNHAKSGLKLLELTARGVACVASPRAAYRRLAYEGIGVLAADRARNWRTQLTALLNDPGHRAEVVKQGQRVIAQQHTYETQGWRWAQAWAEALAHRRAAGRSRVAA